MKKIVIMVFVLLFLATGCLSNVQTQSIEETSELPVLFKGENFTLCKISPDIIESTNLNSAELPTSEKDLVEQSHLIVKCRLIHEPEFVSFVFDTTTRRYNTTLFTVEILKVFYTEQNIQEGDIVKYFSKSFADYYIDETPVFESNGSILPKEDQEFYVFLSNIEKRKVVEGFIDIHKAQAAVSPFYLRDAVRKIIVKAENGKYEFNSTLETLTPKGEKILGSEAGHDTSIEVSDTDMDNLIDELSKKYKG